MAGFNVVEIPFQPEDFERSMEDEFTLVKIKKELENTNDVATLRKGAILLAELAIMRQGLIRGLVRRLADYDCQAIKTKYED
jgi:hypothetical protein